MELASQMFLKRCVKCRKSLLELFNKMSEKHKKETLSCVQSSLLQIIELLRLSLISVTR